MSENDIRIHNIALLYEIYRDQHPDDTETTLFHIAANYDDTVSKLKEELN